MPETKRYITTPIYYVNDKPHIGHAYSTIAADVLARYWRTKLGNANVRFSTGTDENSKKTIEAAELAGQDTKAYADSMATLWRGTWDSLGISYDHFIRTTEPAHHKAAQHFVQKLYDAGDITKGDYEGLYCYRCEQFYKEDELANGKCPVHKIELEVVKEENYFFDLPKYAQLVKDWITGPTDPIGPVSRKNEVLAFIDHGLEKISISRANQAWGIEVPFDASQKVYVWVDALINYLTVAGYPDANYQQWSHQFHHIVGKDIIKFHCIIWPAMLLAAGEALPQTVFAHGFFTIEGEKISKSLGNSIDPLALTAQYGNDALRYYLLREIPFGSDGDFSHARFEAVYNADLANELGNLVQRVAKMITQYCDGKLAPGEPQTHDIAGVEAALEQCRFDVALKEIWVRIRGLNQLVEEEKPWVLAKSDRAQLEKVLAHLAGDLRQIATLLEPFLPKTASEIKRVFGGATIDTSVGILFPKLAPAKAD